MHPYIYRMQESQTLGSLGVSIHLVYKHNVFEQSEADMHSSAQSNVKHQIAKQKNYTHTHTCIYYDCNHRNKAKQSEAKQFHSECVMIAVIFASKVCGK